MTIVDRYGRPVTGLRISVTSRCNLNCIFCHTEGLGKEVEDVVMTPQEIERVTRIAMEFGVNSVKLTGGEPMMRTDILEIVERLGRLGLKDLSMTTNGFRIAELAGDLRKKGTKANKHKPALDRSSEIRLHYRVKGSGAGKIGS